jgi:hypothetical protein
LEYFRKNIEGQKAPLEQIEMFEDKKDEGFEVFKKEATVNNPDVVVADSPHDKFLQWRNKNARKLGFDKWQIHGLKGIKNDAQMISFYQSTVAEHPMKAIPPKPEWELDHKNFKECYTFPQDTSDDGFYEWRAANVKRSLCGRWMLSDGTMIDDDRKLKELYEQRLKFAQEMQHELDKSAADFKDRIVKNYEALTRGQNQMAADRIHQENQSAREFVFNLNLSEEGVDRLKKEGLLKEEKQKPISFEEWRNEHFYEIWDSKGMWRGKSKGAYDGAKYGIPDLLAIYTRTILNSDLFNEPEAYQETRSAYNEPKAEKSFQTNLVNNLSQLIEMRRKELFHLEETLTILKSNL